MTVTIYCQTSANSEYPDDSLEYARLVLDRATALTLLKYRDVYARTVTEAEFRNLDAERLYAVEFFDYRVDFGAFEDAASPFDPTTMGYGEWYSFPTREVAPGDYADAFTTANTSYETMKVRADGVLWECGEKHGSSVYETEHLAWADVEAVAEGRDPFTALEPDPADEVDDEEEDEEEEDDAADVDTGAAGG